MNREPSNQWLVTYVVGDVVCVFPLQSPGLADAATLQDTVAEQLRARGVKPELLTVTGPYSRVQLIGIPVQL